MKSTGIVRMVDPLGRIVMPKELRDTLGIKARDALEIFTDKDNRIVLKKYERGCVFCESLEDNKMFRGKRVCASCVTELQK